MGREEALALFARLRPFLEEGVPLPRLAREAGIPLRTLLRWVAGYRRDGLAGLVRRPRADRGRPRRLVPALRQLIEGLALRSPARPPPRFTGRFGRWRSARAGRCRVTARWPRSSRGWTRRWRPARARG